jgi:hypothetical protein
LNYGGLIVKFFGRAIFSAFIIFIGLLASTAPGAQAGELAQQPTGSIPTVTGTPTGPQVRVNADNDYINVRSGPGTEYTAIGVLIAGEIVSAYGRTVAGDWIQIAYPGVEGGIGWVYSPLVTLISASELPIAEPPPKATPLVTATIDPTLAAQFIVDVPATRLPTFTQPPPLVISTFEPAEPAAAGGGFPVGLIIVVFAAIGILGSLFSLIRGR